MRSLCTDVPSSLRKKSGEETTLQNAPFFSRLVDIRSMITVETSRISLLRERLYAVFDEEGRNNLTTLPTTNLGLHRSDKMVQ